MEEVICRSLKSVFESFESLCFAGEILSNLTFCELGFLPESKEGLDLY